MQAEQAARQSAEDLFAKALQEQAELKSQIEAERAKRTQEWQQLEKDRAELDAVRTELEAEVQNAQHAIKGDAGQTHAELASIE